MRFCCAALTADSAFYYSVTLGNSCRAVVETLRSPFGWEAPVETSTLTGASFGAAKQLSCLSILVSAASMCAAGANSDNPGSEKHMV